MPSTGLPNSYDAPTDEATVRLGCVAGLAGLWCHRQHTGCNYLDCGLAASAIGTRIVPRTDRCCRAFYSANIRALGYFLGLNRGWFIPRG